MRTDFGCWGGDGRLRLGKHQWVRVGSWWVRGLGETRDNVLVGAGYELEVGRISYGIYGVGSEVRLGRVDSAMMGVWFVGAEAYSAEGGSGIL